MTFWKTTDLEPQHRLSVISELAADFETRPGTVPLSSSLENIYGYKAAVSPHSGVIFGMNDKAQEFTKNRYGPLPVFGLPVQVQCDGFKCMAFRDPEGRWVDLFSRKFVARVLGVVPA